MKNQAMTIQNPYFSIGLRSGALESLCSLLKRFMHDCGVKCEVAASEMHVSIAYAEGAAPINELEGIASRIADCDFRLNARGIEILEGKTTPYDYLVLSLEASQAFTHAVTRVEECLSTRRFEGGMKTHVSLLRFAKGILTPELRKSLCARFAAGLKLDRLTVMGECVFVYDMSRECCCQVPLLGAAFAA